MWILLLLSTFALILGLLPWIFAVLGIPGLSITPASAIRIYLGGVAIGAALPMYLLLFVPAKTYWSRRMAHQPAPLSGWATALLTVVLLPFGIWISRNPSAAFGIVSAAGSLLLTYTLVVRFKYGGDAG